MAQHKNVSGGVCFECGRLPGGAPASAAIIATARERIIGRLRGIIAAHRDGRLDVRGEDRTETLAVIASAPVDVADRARKALGLVA